MELDNIVSRFIEFSGLTQEEGENRRSLCADAMSRVDSMRSGASGGQEALEAYAAAMACRRFVLQCLAAGGILGRLSGRAGLAAAFAGLLGGAAGRCVTILYMVWGELLLALRLHMCAQRLLS